MAEEVSGKRQGGVAHGTVPAETGDPNQAQIYGATFALLKETGFTL